MNRKQAGVFAVGVLAVAVAIVTAGGFFGLSAPPPTDDRAAVAPAGTSSPGVGSNAGDAAASAAKRTPKTGQQAEGPYKPGNETAANGADAGRAAAGAGAGGSAATVPADLAQQSAPATEGSATTSTPGSGGSAPVAAGPTDRTASRPVVPTFDLLRVEPDGSTVIAGHAAPGSTVQVVGKDGNDPLLTTEADDTGGFVAVFDRPLAPGNYELRLKSIGKDKSVRYSEEVATVSVPRDGKGSDLLAMVSKPGEASRIFTAPQADAATAKAEAAAPKDMSKVASVKPTGEDATAAPGGGSGATLQSQQVRAKIHVDAVEIEGDRMYVAGAAPRGSVVRVYADDKLVGESRATSEGRFVVNGKTSLGAGRHTVRADLIDRSTGKVTMRATVPFDRPSGGDFSAISPQMAGKAPGAGSGLAAPSGSGGPATVVQPALTNSQNFVIIRRGDTLWQISRRTYGRGIRYTTIYLANSDQISNPNLILPGQVFDVPGKPEKSVDQAIELHRELLLKERRGQ